MPARNSHRQGLYYGTIARSGFSVVVTNPRLPLARLGGYWGSGIFCRATVISLFPAYQEGLSCRTTIRLEMRDCGCVADIPHKFQMWTSCMFVFLRGVLGSSFRSHEQFTIRLLVYIILPARPPLFFARERDGYNVGLSDGVISSLSYSSVLHFWTRTLACPSLKHTNVV